MIATLRCDYFKECNGAFIRTKMRDFGFESLGEIEEEMERMRKAAYRKCQTMNIYVEGIK